MAGGDPMDCGGQVDAAGGFLVADAAQGQAPYHDINHSAKAPPDWRGGRRQGRRRERAKGIHGGGHRSQEGGVRGIRRTQTSVKASQCGQRKCQAGASTLAVTTMATARSVSTIVRRRLAAGCIQPK